MEGTEVDRRLREQIAYYDRRAPEYDETSDGSGREAVRRFRRWVERLAPTGEILEVACGTGLFTQHLVRGGAVTALDSSPEMIELARARLAPASASFIVADFFDWRPERRYDCVFFGFWLSHVPAERFDDFFARVEDCLGPGGRALFVDESAERAPRAAGGRPRRSPVVERRLRDGSAYRIVKVFHEPAELAATLAGIGWSARVEPLEDGFMAGVAEPAAALSRG